MGFADLLKSKMHLTQLANRINERIIDPNAASKEPMCTKKAALDMEIDKNIKYKQNNQPLFSFGSGCSGKPDTRKSNCLSEETQKALKNPNNLSEEQKQKVLKELNDAVEINKKNASA